MIEIYDTQNVLLMTLKKSPDVYFKRVRLD